MERIERFFSKVNLAIKTWDLNEMRALFIEFRLGISGNFGNWFLEPKFELMTYISKNEKLAPKFELMIFLKNEKLAPKFKLMIYISKNEKLAPKLTSLKLLVFF